jgi:hypothetical protein
MTPPTEHDQIALIERARPVRPFAIDVMHNQAVGPEAPGAAALASLERQLARSLPICPSIASGHGGSIALGVSEISGLRAARLSP